jgi:hypothetical protein
MCLGSSRADFQWIAEPDGPRVWCSDDPLPVGIGEHKIWFSLGRFTTRVYECLEFIDASDKSHDVTIEYSNGDHLLFYIQSSNASYAFQIPFESVCMAPPVRPIIGLERSPIKLHAKTYSRTVRYLVAATKEPLHMICMNNEIKFHTSSKSALATIKCVCGDGRSIVVDADLLAQSDRVRVFSTSDCYLRIRSSADVRVECKINVRSKSDGLFISFPLHKSIQAQ